MHTLTLEDICYHRTEAEQRLRGLALRKCKQLLKMLKQTPFCYFMAEGFDISKLWEIENNLTYEKWALEALIEEGKTIEE